MYKIIGADHREYGPVSAEQLREWITQHRANAQTQIQAEGATDWKPLSAFPEFADLVGASMIPPPRVAPVPPTGRGPGDHLADAILARNYQLFIGECIGRSWNLLFQRFWLLAGGSALVFLLFIGITSIPFVGTVACVLLTFVLWGGLDLLFLRYIRGQSADLGTLFIGFSTAFVPLMLASLVASVLTSLGLLLCILPGIYLSVCWQMFTPLLILDKGLDFWQAMECSRRVVTRHWWTCFALALVSTLAIVLGLLACFIGFFITLPLAVGMIVYAYEDIFGTETALAELTPAAEPTLAPVPAPAAADTPTPTPTPSPASTPQPSPETSVSPAPLPESTSTPTETAPIQEPPLKPANPPVSPAPAPHDGKDNSSPTAT